MILEVHNLRRQFGGICAVDDVSFSVAANQTHAVIGPNGAGKTTLLAQLSGAQRPDGGRIRWHGADITHLPGHQRARLGLARSFQISSVILPMTLLENVMLAALGGARVFKFWSPLAADADLRARAMRILERTGLAEHADLPAAAAAHGQQRQLEFAMALAPRPQLLMLDEPMAGLGGAESMRMLALLREIKKTTAILLIEHDMEAVFALADVVSVLVHGRLIATGSAAEIRQNREVQHAYLGAPASSPAPTPAEVA